MSIRPASHAGSWYSDNDRQLHRQLDEWLGKVPSMPSLQRARAIISPHAGYSYSGPTAAYSFKHLNVENGIKRVFVLGPSHHHYLTNCALSNAKICRTPLGDLTVDTRVNQELMQSRMFDVMSQSVDEDEHSIEMQLPFIAKRLGSAIGGCTIVPVMVGSLSEDAEQQFGAIFARYLDDPQNFFVISSDFCHWGKRFRYTAVVDQTEVGGPNLGTDGIGNSKIDQSIKALDYEGIRHISNLDPRGYAEYQRRTQNTICGRHPISVLLHATKKSTNNRYQMQFIRHCKSSECETMADSSVSYASGILTIA